MSKTVGNVTFRDDGTVLIRMVRASYCFPFEPREQTSDDGKVTRKFQCTGILPIRDEKHGLDNREAIKALNEHFQGIAVGHFKKKIPQDKYAFRDGRPTEKEEYANSFIIVASQTADRPPKVVGRNPKKILTAESDPTVYSGCWINMIINPWVQKPNPAKNIGARINANLLLIQFVEEDDAFSTEIKVDPTEAFEDLGGDDEGGSGDFSLNDDDDGLGLD